MTRFCIDPVTIGFDSTLEEYVQAVAVGGFTSAEWPVIWGSPEHGGSVARARDVFERTGVEPLQFTSAIGVPSNLAVDRTTFAARLTEFDALCRIGQAVGSKRVSLFVDEHRHGGVPLSVDELVERVSRIALAPPTHRSNP